MKTIRMQLGVALALAAASTGAGAADCRPVRAQITSTATTTGCTSPIGLCTSGTIDGNAGLDGTTFLTADGFAPGPATASNAPNTISYSGIFQITTRFGTLTTRQNGIFDPLPAGSGSFATFDIVTGGSGRYAGATGTLYVAGRTNAATGQFVSDVSGSLCRP